MFDVYVMLFFGVAGFILRQLNFPMAPLVLGIVLGDLMEKNLRRGLVLSDGDLTPFFTRPIAFVMFALVAATVLMNIPAFQRMTAQVWTAATGPFRRDSGRRPLGHAHLALQRGDRRIAVRAAVRSSPPRSAMTALSLHRSRSATIRRG